MIVTKIEDHSAAVIAAKNAAVRVALEEIGMVAEGRAKTRVSQLVYDQPEKDYVRTGRLRNGIAHKVEDNKVLVGDRVEYARYIELGTSKMKARPFIKPSIFEHLPEYKKIIEAHLKL